MRPWIKRNVAGTAVPPAPSVPLECHFEFVPRRRDYQIGVGMILVSILALVGAATRRVRK